MTLSRRGRWMIRAGLVTGLALNLSSCSGGPTPARSGVHVPVILKDFHVGVANRPVQAGPVTFDIRNPGPSTHEFLIVRTNFPPAGLPLGPDGLTVDEAAPGLQLVEEDPELDIGASRALQVDLSPGYYVLYCNLEGHYLGGMRTKLVVIRASRA